MKKLVRNDLIYALFLFIYILFQLYLITSVPDVMEDEPWYANTAFNFVHGKGFVNTNVGIYGGDFFVFYTFLLSIGIKLFGCSLIVTRIISVVGGLIFLWGLICILKKLKVSLSLSILVLLIFIFSNITYIIFRTTRPEGWILAFGVWSIFYLINYHESKKVKNIILAAIFASLSFFIHPNGILFIIDLGIYFLIRAILEKRISHLLYFSAVCTILILTYFIIIFSTPAFSISKYLDQISSRTSLSNSNYNIIDNIMNFFTIYTLGIKRLYILIFELCSLLFGFFISKRGSLLRYITFFGLLNLILSILLFSPYAFRHFGEIIIFSILSFLLIINSISKHKYRIALIAFGLVYLMNNIAGDGYIILKKYRNTPYSEIEKELTGIIPDNSIVITSLHLWYPLQNMQFYCEYTYWGSKPFTDLQDLLKNNCIDYIIYTDYFLVGKTGTSGRGEEIPPKIKMFFNNVVQLSNNYGQLIHSYTTKGFGTIQVFRINIPKNETNL